MIVWILALLGYVVAATVSSAIGADTFVPGLVGALVGGAVGWLLKERRQGEESRDADSNGHAREPVLTWQQSVSALTERVARLEAEVAFLRSSAGMAQREATTFVHAPAVTERTQQAPAAPPEPPAREAQPLSPAVAAPAPRADAVRKEIAPPTQPDEAYAATRAAPLATAASAATPQRAKAAEPVVPTEPPKPAEPAKPNIVERLVNAAIGWLLGGNTVVRVGIIVLLFGVAFLLKYAADNSLLPIEFRIAGVAAGAVAMLVAGQRIGTRRGAYGLVLQGGGLGILYLVVFAAARLYQLLPASAALGFMIAICGLGAFLAVRQDARPLAFMGSAGGFLAPVLLSNGSGNHVALFSYYLVLNIGILAMAWFKAWRPLNLLGFVFTFTIGTAWGVTAYRPELLVSTEPFLIAFFLIYTGIALLYARHREIALKHYIDGTLVFGTPIVVAGLQAALMRDVPFGLAWSAVALAAFYLGVAAWLRPRRARLGLLFESMLAIAVLFATLALPFAFSGPTTSAAWAVEGAALVWVSVRERRLAPFYFGIAMQGAAACAFAYSVSMHAGPGGLPFLNSMWIATLLIAVAGVFTGWWLHGRQEARAWHAWTPLWGLVGAIWGLAWWLGGGAWEILRYATQHAVADGFIAAALVLLFVLTAWLAHIARRRLAWPLAEWVALALAPALALMLMNVYDTQVVPLHALGALAWPLALVGAYVLLFRQQRDVSTSVLAPLHTLMFLNLCAILAMQGYWTMRAWVPEGAWSWSAWAYGMGAMLLAVTAAGSRLRWPVRAFERAYVLWGAAPLALALWAWSVASAQSDGDASPLVWIPLLNPLDVAQMLAALALIVWFRRLSAMGVSWRPAWLGYAVLASAFLWFNSLILRGLHQYAHAAYDVDAVLSTFAWQEIFIAGWGLALALSLRFVRGEARGRMITFAATPLVAIMWLWALYATLFQDGGSLARIPLLNPLDLLAIMIFAIAGWVLVRLKRQLSPTDDWRNLSAAVAGATLFLWLNTVLLRTLSHWAGIPYNVDDLVHSTLAQVAVSLFWTVCALSVMLWSTRRAMRVWWFVGGTLLAVTVVKLFIFDLSHVQGVQRIVSFIGVGVLLLVIGYVSPLPPRSVLAEEAKS
ncbi:DUF2339 domain-containing protein [Paraburkholderia bannensis]|uniref:DUF2339 domain-containing protein n=1 Tax=Paraburkholderia bannensis TaxID=765414 RepID=UPI002AB69723|nr:DUF2339 domain-containing protein [Paraburkholderia bannensis]